jgi:hypothetical protein
MTTTDDICHLIQTLWNENGLATENVSEPLQAYWARGIRMIGVPCPDSDRS